VRLIAIPLGELSRTEAQSLLERQFSGYTQVWFDRSLLRQQPLRVLFDLWRQHYDAAVLIAHDVDQPRLRVTSFVLGLARAQTYWRMDGQSRCERWRVSEHLQHNAVPILRHILACGLALVGGELALRAIHTIVVPRKPRDCAAAPLPPPSSMKGNPSREASHVTAGGGKSVMPTSQNASHGVFADWETPSAVATTSRTDALIGEQDAVTHQFAGKANAGLQPVLGGATASVPRSPRPLPAVVRTATEDGSARGRRTRNDGVGPPHRILYLRSQLWLGLSGGGSVAHTAGVIGGLQQLGADVRVVSSDRLLGVSAPTRVVAPEIWFDGWLRELEDIAYNASFLRGAWRAARAFRPDAIYQRHTAFNVGGALLARLLRVPFVLEYNSSELWKGRYWGGLRLRRAARLVERINLGAADRIVVVSRVLRDELITDGIPSDRILINPNGVDPEVFHADAGGEAVRHRLGLESNVVVGFSGTFGAWHGIPTLAQVIPLVLAARPDARWLIMGDGPLRATLDEAVAEAGDRVVRVGMLRHAEMPAYLAACDIVVSPHGRQADGGEFFGSPTKLYEYMAAGRAIVASRLGQIAEVLEDEATALLVEPDDPRALADAVVRLVDDACLRARLGHRAREAAVQRHTWGQNAGRVLAALERA
jgi:glycosyltransferase involved in cell wall biosynthesis